MPIHDINTLKFEQTMTTVNQLLNENKIPAIILAVDPRGEIAHGWTAASIPTLRHLLREAYDSLVVQFYSMEKAAARGNPKPPEVVRPDSEPGLLFINKDAVIKVHVE